MSYIKLHLLMNPKFLGDKNQALGIKTMLEKQYQSGAVETREWDDSNAKELAALQGVLNTDADSQHILVAIGDHGLQALQMIKATLNTFSVYSSHQILPGLKEVIGQIDIIALPTHVVDDQFRQAFSKSNSKLIETIGVAHNVSRSELDKANSDWQKESKEPIVPSENYIGVILGGDAPEPNETMRYFTASEATLLGKFLVELSKENNNATLLITNSPRTGKYDPTTQQEQKVHTGEKLDETSKALLNELNLHRDVVKYQFFNFVLGKPSAYKSILGVLQNNGNSIVVVTGDSTSMVTKIGDSLVGKPLYVVNVESMNDSHKAHVRSVNEAGYAHLVTLCDQGNQVQLPKKSESTVQRMTAAESIAKAIHGSLPIYVVGRPVPFVSYSWFVPDTNHWDRKNIYGKEICNSFYQTATNQFTTLSEATTQALTDTSDYESKSSSGFMRAYCPIFKLSQGKITQVLMPKDLNKPLNNFSTYNAYSFADIQQGLFLKGEYHSGKIMAATGFWKNQDQCKKAAVLSTVTAISAGVAVLAYTLGNR